MKLFAKRLLILTEIIGRNPGQAAVACLGVALVVLAPGCSRQNQADPELVAQIGKREIRVAEFQDWMRRRGVGTNDAQKAALIEEMFDHFAAVQQAEKLGLERDPEIRRSWENLLVGKLRERQLEKELTKVAITPAQSQLYYSNHLASYSEPAMRRGAVLFCEVNHKATAEEKSAARARLEEARVKALQQPTTNSAPQSFGALAVEYSVDQATRYRGGDMGWLVEGKLDNRFDKAALEALFALSQPNDLSEVVETPRGYYLVKLLEARPQRAKAFNTVQAAIEHRLILETRQQLETEWKRSLRSACESKTYPEVLHRVTGDGLRQTEAEAPPAIH